MLSGFRMLDGCKVYILAIKVLVFRVWAFRFRFAWFGFRFVMI